jgi:hypothetical protein
MILFLVTWAMRILDVVFFVGVSGALAAVALSWISIAKSVLSSDQPHEDSGDGRDAPSLSFR